MVLPQVFFRSSRGLRQRDPLSLYLFVIVMEAFSQMIQNLSSRGKGGTGEKVSHLLFVDDTLIFCEASQDQLTYLCWLLMLFEACFGLKINMEKSKLFPMGRVSNAKVLADELGCKMGNLPTTYLGVLIVNL